MNEDIKTSLEIIKKNIIKIPKSNDNFNIIMLGYIDDINKILGGTQAVNSVNQLHQNLYWNIEKFESYVRTDNGNKNEETKISHSSKLRVVEHLYEVLGEYKYSLFNNFLPNKYPLEDLRVPIINLRVPYVENEFLKRNNYNSLFDLVTDPGFNTLGKSKKSWNIISTKVFDLRLGYRMSEKQYHQVMKPMSSIEYNEIIGPYVPQLKSSGKYL